MYKRLFICLTVIFFSLSIHASAHSELISSTPSDGSTVQKSISAIKLQFGERIEKVVKMDLKNNSGKTFQIQKPDVQGKNLTVHIKKPLPSGAYTMKWKVISIDGHAISQELSFNIGNKTANQSSDSKQSKKNQQLIKNQETPVFLMMFIFLLLVIGTAVYLMFKNRQRH